MFEAIFKEYQEFSLIFLSVFHSFYYFEQKHIILMEAWFSKKQFSLSSSEGGQTPLDSSASTS